MKTNHLLTLIIAAFSAMSCSTAFAQTDEKSAPSTAVKSESDQTKIVTLGDFDATNKFFSLRKGKIISLEKKGASALVDMDILLDMPHGLGTNNAELSKAFNGKAGIIDLGSVPLKSKSNIPKNGFKKFLKAKEIIVGHTYLVRTADGVSYGKIHVVKFEEKTKLLEFTWLLLNTTEEKTK